jgi:hypothetical protein
MTKKESKIQRIELADTAQGLFCPFCGARGLPPAEEWGQVAFEPCRHVLFIAHDLEFEYRAKRFDRLMKIEDVDGDELELPDENGIDGFTDGTPLADAIKFASYEGPPSFYGTYIGFAPADES